jgi:hypothetical protein
VEELVVTEHARERVGPPAGVDDRAERVADTAGQNEGGRSRARSVEDLREDENADPPEGDIDDRGQPLGCGDPGELRDDRDGGSTPDNDEDGLLPGTVKDEQAERGVGAGDQSEDACVIEPP